MSHRVEQRRRRGPVDLSDSGGWGLREVGVPVIRVFSFRAARRGFDDTLRSVFVPDLMSRAGIVDCYVGRQGPDDEGPRIVATVWTSRGAMVDAVGEELGVFHPEHLDATTDQVLDILELRVDWHPAGEPPRILRVLRGDVRPGELSCTSTTSATASSSMRRPSTGRRRCSWARPDRTRSSRCPPGASGRTSSARPGATLRGPWRPVIPSACSVGRWSTSSWSRARIDCEAGVMSPARLRRGAYRPGPILRSPPIPDDRRTTDERDHPAQGRPREDASC